MTDLLFLMCHRLTFNKTSSKTKGTQSFDRIAICMASPNNVFTLQCVVCKITKKEQTLRATENMVV